MKKRLGFTKAGIVLAGFTCFFLCGAISSIIRSTQAGQIALFFILTFATALIAIAMLSLGAEYIRKFRSGDYYVREVIVTQKSGSGMQRYISVNTPEGQEMLIDINYRFSKDLYTGARGMLVALPNRTTHAIDQNSYFFIEEELYAQLQNVQTPSLSEHEALLPSLKKEARPWKLLFFIPLLLANILGAYQILFVEPGDLIVLMIISFSLTLLSLVLPIYTIRRNRGYGPKEPPTLLWIIVIVGEFLVGNTPLMKQSEFSTGITAGITCGFILFTILYLVMLLQMTARNRRLSRAAKNRDYEIAPASILEKSSEIYGSGRSYYKQYYLHVQDQTGKVRRLPATRMRTNKMEIGEKGTLVRVKDQKNPTRPPEYYFLR
ncbi:MAG: hypothetical protein J6Y58_11240 [Clostridiales bacterium]|nr:hypothetical protein [Clostridiales bacterium]